MKASIVIGEDSWRRAKYTLYLRRAKVALEENVKRGVERSHLLDSLAGRWTGKKVPDITTADRITRFVEPQKPVVRGWDRSRKDWRQFQRQRRSEAPKKIPWMVLDQYLQAVCPPVRVFESFF